MERSSELKHLLGEGMAAETPAEEVQASVNRTIEYDQKYQNGTATERIRERLGQEADRLEELEAERDALAVEAADMDDQEFDRRARELERNVRMVGDLIKFGSGDIVSDHVAEFVDISKIGSLEEFRKQWL